MSQGSARERSEPELVTNVAAVLLLYLAVQELLAVQVEQAVLGDPAVQEDQAVLEFKAVPNVLDPEGRDFNQR